MLSRFAGNWADYESALGDVSDGRSERAKRLRADRRSQVLVAARAAFSELGYHSTSVSEIIQRAKIARGTFYLYFESKHAIFDELLDDLLRRILGSVKRIEVGAGAPAPVDQVRALVGRLLDILVEHRDVGRLLMHEAVGLDEYFDAKLQSFYRSLIDRLVGALDLGQRVGLVRPCDSGLQAYCMLGSFKEIVYQQLVLGDPVQFDREAVIRVVVDYNLHGVMRGGNPGLSSSPGGGQDP